MILCMIGEILPQALCTKFSLPIGSYTRYFTYFCIYLTTIASYPLSKIVDFVLGKELPTKYSRDTIKEMIKKSQGLHEQQCQIINAALDLKSKHVSDVMVKMDKVFMIHVDEDLTFELIATIYNSGFSRIPVFRASRCDIVGWLHIKDLTIIDPEDEIRVSKLIEYHKRRLVFCSESDSIVELFEMFQRGSTHLAFVRGDGLVVSVDDEFNKNCFHGAKRQIIGIVTLHDVMQALFQSNLGDEQSRGKTGINYLKRVVEDQKRKSTFFVNINSANANSNPNSCPNKINVYDSMNRLIEENPTFPESSGEKKLTREFKVSLQTKFNILQILASMILFKF
jgi:metal transporter CNNM